MHHRLTHIRLVIYLSLFTFLLVANYFSNTKGLFISKIILLTIYQIFEISILKRSTPHNLGLNPVVLASVFTFLLSFGITNFVYFTPNNYSYNFIYNILGPEPFKFLNKAMDYIILAAFFMWFGYRAKLGDKFFNFLTNNALIKKSFFRRSDSLRLEVVLFLLIVSIISRIIQINLGLFGYAGDPESREIYGGIWNILYLIGSVGSLILVITSFNYYKKKTQKILFIMSFIVELLFGLLSGMKSEIMLPFFIIAFTYYLANGRIRKSTIAFAVFAIIIAYIIVEPFRILRMTDKRFTSDPYYIFSTIVDSYEMNKRAKLVEQQSIDAILFQFFSRLEYTLTTARAIQYKDQVGLDARAQDFRERLLTIPLQAYIPRAIWSNKPLEDSGVWYSVNVWGSVETSSVAYSPIGFAYFAGGIIPLIIIFIIIGVLQKTLFNFLKLGSGGIVIYFGLLLSVVLIDSKVNTIFVSWLRNIPILFILQAILYKK